MSQDTSPGKTMKILPQVVSNGLVAVGSNQVSSFGSPLETVHAAVEALSANGILIRKKSPIFRTQAYPAGSGPDFANAALSFSVKNKSASEVLQILHGIEADFGRERTQRWSPRTLDLDLLAWDDSIEPDESTLNDWMNLPPELQSQTTPSQMILPHPRLHERAFVLVPLSKVAPDWQHPILGKSVQQMCDALPSYLKDEVRLYE
ncbi:MAG: 2-amino-4-hydroxy-6-hydroxymethyldihydropteridine diphosphokinase [Paracoccaceae bacterium]